MDNEHQYDVRNFSKIDENALVIDVRPELEYKICNLENTINYPYARAQKNSEEFIKFLKDKVETGIKKGKFIDSIVVNNINELICLHTS